jgi:hypothetical protein
MESKKQHKAEEESLVLCVNSEGLELRAKLYRRAELFPATSLEPIKIRSVTDLPRRQKNNLCCSLPMMNRTC